MIVVADTSPLNYLIQIEAEWILPKLYGSVIVPRAVLRELRHPLAPPSVSLWADATPSWLSVATASLTSDPGHAGLDPGETEAIALVQEVGAGLVLMDELKGRTIAQARGIRVIGVLGILTSADLFALADARTLYQRLIRETRFRCSRSLEKTFFDGLQAPEPTGI